MTVQSSCAKALGTARSRACCTPWNLLGTTSQLVDVTVQRAAAGFSRVTYLFWKCDRPPVRRNGGMAEFPGMRCPRTSNMSRCCVRHVKSVRSRSSDAPAKSKSTLRPRPVAPPPHLPFKCAPQARVEQPTPPPLRYYVWMRVRRLSTMDDYTPCNSCHDPVRQHACYLGCLCSYRGT